MSNPSYDVVTAELLERPTAPFPLETAVPLASLPTPVLLLNEAGLERNIEKMAAFLRSKGKGFRPHAKTHKCPEIARRQMASGAVGICAAKVSEAFVLVNAGIDKVLVTSAILSAAKADVLVALSRQAQVDVVVDSLAGFEVLSAALSSDDEIGVLVDLDVELGRTDLAGDSRMSDHPRRHDAHRSAVCVRKADISISGREYAPGRLSPSRAASQHRRRSGTTRPRLRR